MTTLEVQYWHQNHLCRWVHKYAESECLEPLCTTVAKALEMAADKMQQLQKWSLRQRPLPEGNTDRAVALSALDDVIGALRAFEVVAHSPILQIPQDMSMVLVYLKRVLKVTIILGKLLAPTRSDSWFECFEGFIHHLEGFWFDCQQDYQRISDPTIPGVIVDAASVPSPCLPANPTAPRLYRSAYQSNGEYRPRIVLNEFD
jgi:hypothetical protein